MTLRSVRTLQSKLRSREDAASESVEMLMAQLAERVAALNPSSSPRVRDQPELIAVLQETLREVVDVGVSLLRDTLVENLRALGRDLKAIEASLDRRFDGLAAAAFDAVDPDQLLGVYESELRASLIASWRVMVEELDRQAALSERYEDSLVARWTSQKPARLPGRRGRGVIPSMKSVVHATMVNWMYGMVNGQRKAVVDAANRIVEQVDRR